MTDLVALMNNQTPFGLARGSEMRRQSYRGTTGRRILGNSHFAGKEARLDHLTWVLPSPDVHLPEGDRGRHQVSDRLGEENRITK